MARTTITGLRTKASQDRSELGRLLDTVHIGHFALVAEDGQPVVLPTVVARDGDRMLAHGSTRSGWIRRLAAGAPASLAVTSLDALVVARSAFESSMRYRSAVIFGQCVPLTDPDEKLRALDTVVEALLPGRLAEVRRPRARSWPGRSCSRCRRGRYTPGRKFGSYQRGLVPRLTKLPWIPTDQQWLAFLEAARSELPRNRVMLAPAYEAASRREELCSLRTDDLDPGRRTVRVRAETTKNWFERVVPYSASTGVLLSGYLRHRVRISTARGPLFLSESRRNHGKPLTLWRWSKIVRRLAVAADLPRFSTHTTR